jgi:hypothetical protein
MDFNVLRMNGSSYLNRLDESNKPHIMYFKTKEIAVKYISYLHKFSPEYGYWHITPQYMKQLDRVNSLSLIRKRHL